MSINYFSDDELRCSCGCGELHFDDEVLERLNEIREDFGYQMIVTSGYRCNNHPLEKVKIRPGAHTTGKAVDIAVSFDSAHRLLTIALAHGCPRVGVNQKGTRRFIHLDWAENYPSPTVWSY